MRVENNLKAMGGEGRPREVYRHFAYFFYEFFSHRSRDQELWPMESFRAEAERVLGKPGESQQAVILLSPHTGNWELCSKVLVYLGYRVSAVALRHEPDDANSIFVDLRGHENFEVIYLDDGVRPCLRALKEERIVGLVCERDYAKSGREVEVLGRRVPFPVGASYLHLKTKIPLVFSTFFRSGLGHFSLKLEKLQPESLPEDKDKAITQITQMIATTCFDLIREHPEQWVTFEDYFGEGV